MNRLYRLHQWLSMDEVKGMWLPILFANQAGMYGHVHWGHAITLI